MSRPQDDRVEREKAFGRELAAGDPERVWKHRSIAGRIRAERRGRMIAGKVGRPGDRILEIGCGTGLFTSFLAATGASITALDVSPELLKLAEQRRLPNVQLVCASFDDWVPKEQFDAIAGSSFLHHLDPVPALRRMIEILKPGGRVVFAEPNFLNPHVYVERRFRRWFPSVSPDESAFVRWSLRARMIELGFQDVRVVPFDFLHPSTPPLLTAPIGAIGRVLEHIPLVREFAGSLFITAHRARS